MGWRDPNADRRAVEDALEASRPAWDLLAADLDANGDLVGWFDSLVDDGPFGEAVAACRRRYERTQPRLCRWQQDIVLRREDDGTATVVAVRARVASDLADPLAGGEDPTPQCRAFAACVAEAWARRRGRFPSVPDDLLTRSATGEGYLAVTAPVHHLEAHGLSPAEYEAAYRRRIKEIRRRIEEREAYLARAENEDLRSRAALDGIYQSLLLERAWLADYRRYLQRLEEAGP